MDEFPLPLGAYCHPHDGITAWGQVVIPCNPIETENVINRNVLAGASTML